MDVFIFWIIFSLVVGFIGSNRKIGFWGAFLCALLLSPLLGLIITLVSKSKDAEAYEKRVLKNQIEQRETLGKLENSAVSTYSVSEELNKLILLRDQDEISEEEFQKLRSRIINS